MRGSTSACSSWWSRSTATLGASATSRDARPPAACHFLQNGAAVTDHRAILGRSNLATTQVYARMVDERMRASIRALDYGMVAKEPGKVSEVMQTRIPARAAGVGGASRRRKSAP
jgi:hypothetical protein